MTKIGLIGINSKYIHPNMAIRILYNDLRQHHIGCEMIESNIKEDMDTLIDKIKDFEIVCFSVYIFNVTLIKELTFKLKAINPKLIIILGGPEVSYSNSQDLQDIAFDYVVCGEGEQVLVDLIAYINKDIDIIPSSVTYKKDNEIVLNTSINEVPLDYTKDLTNDFSLVDLDNQIAYLETSRGCPYLCAYCLASLDNHVRLFDLDLIKAKIDELISKKAKMVKLLDRTFNFNVVRTNELISYIIEKDNLYTTFQLEITGELLSPSTIQLINDQARPSLFRFEIGIQSTNPLSNKAVRRYQNFDKLKEIIIQLQAADKIVFHLDLIAGLPFEDLTSFKKTFDDVFSLYPDELQLGFLKLLKGTYLNESVVEYGYLFEKEAPYEIIQNQWLNRDDLAIIRGVEDALDHYYNKGKAKDFITFYLKEHTISPFDLLRILSKHIYRGIDVYNLFVNLIEQIELTFDDKIVLFKNYYGRSNGKVKSLYKVESKRELLHLLSEQDNQNTRNVFKYACVDQIDNENYFIYKVDDQSCYLANMKDGYINEI